MDDSVNELIYFLVWALPETALDLLCNCLVGASPYTRYTLRDTIIPFVRREGSPRTKNDLTRPQVVTAKKDIN